MLTTNARASYSGLSLLMDIKYTCYAERSHISVDSFL